jgi:VWFA-related protein
MRLNLYPKSIVALLALLLAATAAKAQIQPKPAPSSPPATQHPILLDVVVTDRAGNPIPGLKQSDFTVLDDKHPQAITSFREAVGVGPGADPPVQAMVLVDGYNNTYHRLELLRVQVVKYLRQNSELPLPMSLDLITYKSQSQTEPTRNGNAVAESLDSAKLGLDPIHTMDEWVAFQKNIAELIKKEVSLPGRKLLVLLGPGWPHEMGRDERLQAERNKFLFENIIWMSTMLRQARITLYSVDFREAVDHSTNYQQFLKGATSPQDFSLGNLTLKVLAVQSGGEVLNQSNNVDESISRCLRDARVYYTLTFQPEPGSPPGKYHDLQVRVDKPGLIVRTRTGYYSGPDSEEDGLAPFHNFSLR